MEPSTQNHTARSVVAPERICPLEELIKVIGGKWKVIILWQVLTGPQRFGELRRHMPGITHKMLSQQLREMERDGLIQRTVFAEVPLRVEYRTTPLSESSRELIQAMHDWAKRELPACRNSN